MLIYQLIRVSIYADRGEVPKGSAEIFFRKVKFWKEDEAEEAPPVFVGILCHKATLGLCMSYLGGKKNSFFVKK